MRYAALGGDIFAFVARSATYDVSSVTISLWATDEALRAYERSDVLQDKIAAKLAPFVSGQYDTRVSRVRFVEGDPAPSEWLSPLEC